MPIPILPHFKSSSPISIKMDTHPAAADVNALLQRIQTTLDSLDETTSNSFKQFLERLKDERLGILVNENGDGKETQTLSGVSG